MSTPHFERAGLIRELHQAKELLDQKQYLDARSAFERVYDHAAAVGAPSSYVCWLLAVCCDYLHDHANAVRWILEAVELDPLTLAAEHSRTVIADRIRRALISGEPTLDGPDTLGLYELLVRLDAADLSAHLVAARHHAAAGSVDVAIKLLDAITMLHPRDRVAWMTLMEIARAAGRELEAARAEAALLAIDASSVVARVRAQA